MINLFGTDGIRDIMDSGNMSVDIIKKIGFAIASELSGDCKECCIVIGQDTRASCKIVKDALICGITSAKINVKLIQEAHTSCVSVFTRLLKANAGIMITASHNQFNYNGIKIFDHNGLKIGIDVEKAIESKVYNIEDDFKSSVVVADSSKIEVIDNCEDKYLAYLRDMLSAEEKDYSGIKVVFDCANGATYKIARKLFDSINVDAIIINDRPDGFNINKKCGVLHMEQLSQTVLESNACLGIAVDGDGDRIVICDEKGEVVNGDNLIASIVKSKVNDSTISEKGVVVNILSSVALEKYLSALGIVTYRSDVGDRNVSDLMKKKGCNLGAEESGHIILSDFSYTSDSLLLSIKLLYIISNSNLSVSKLFNEFKIHCVKEKMYFDDIDLVFINVELQTYIKQLHDDKLQFVRILLRKSGTEKGCLRIYIESDSDSKCHTIFNKISSIIYNKKM